jgi:hypothetical protein
MNHLPCLSTSRLWRCGLYALLTGLAVPAFPQAIPVTTPRLPARASNPSVAPQPAAQPYAQTAQQPGMQAGAQPGAYANSATQPYPQGSMYAAPGPSQSAMYPAQAAQPNPYGAAYGAPSAPVAMVTPPKAAAGNCRAQPTPDRQTLVLVSGAEALARQHVPLGEFRSQQVVHSPDGRWAVVFTKLRGAAQFAAMTVDLERCEMQRTIDIPATGEDARFEGDEAVLRLADRELRVGLRDGRMR